VGAGFWVAEESANALVELGTDDVLEPAGLLMGLGVADGKRVGEKTFGKTVTADDIAGAAGAGIGEADFAIGVLDEAQIGHAR